MLSKPKMPVPYNTVVDANNGITCSCTLTEGNVARYETTIMDLYGNTVVTTANEKGGIGYWTPNSPIFASTTNKKLKNGNEYKWQTRLFEYNDVDVWTAYGTLQNVDDGDSPVTMAKTDGKTNYFLKVSAHQNIAVNNSETSIYNVKTFPIHVMTDYLVDGKEYKREAYPLAYGKDDDGKYKFIYLSDEYTGVQSDETTEPKQVDIPSDTTIESIGILDDMIQHPLLSGYRIATVYDFSGHIYQCLTTAKYKSTYLYKSNGKKKAVASRIYKYTLQLDENNNIVLCFANQNNAATGRDCKGAYSDDDYAFVQNKGTAKESIHTQCAADTLVISARDYQQSLSTETDTSQAVKELYHFKYGGKKYLITDFQLQNPTEDNDIDYDTYTYAYMAIKNIDGSELEEEDYDVFKSDTQYTIYRNFIDSDEFYFKTHCNLFPKIKYNNSNEFLNADETIFNDLIEGEFQGYLTDIDDNLYQNEIVSYLWTISVPTVMSSQIIYQSGMQYGNKPYLKYSGFVANQDYLIQLTINTNDGTYISDTYTIRTEPYVPAWTESSFDDEGNITEVEKTWVNPASVSVQFNNIKQCVDIELSDNFQSSCISLVGQLNDFPDIDNPSTVSFDRIDIFRTSNNSICHKVASIGLDELGEDDGIILYSWTDYATDTSNGHIEDYIVGGGNSYEYLVYPVLKFEHSDYSEYKYLTPLISNKIIIPLYGMAVVGLVPQTDDEGNIMQNAYLIDYENIWHFYLNAKNESSTFNVAHTLHTGQERFGKMSVGRRGYITSNISALLGDVNCNSSKRYLDNMDTIDLWEDFINNGELKIVCDQYGRILPCDINECSYSYEENGQERLCTVNFSYTQLADYDNIEVLFNNDYFELTDYIMIGNQFGQALSAQNDGVNNALGTLR